MRSCSGEKDLDSFHWSSPHSGKPQLLLLKRFLNHQNDCLDKQSNLLLALSDIIHNAINILGQLR